MHRTKQQYQEDCVHLNKRKLNNHVVTQVKDGIDQHYKSQLVHQRIEQSLDLAFFLIVQSLVDVTASFLLLLFAQARKVTYKEYSNRN